MTTATTQRTYQTFKVCHLQDFARKLLHYGSSNESFCFLNSNNHQPVVRGSLPGMYGKYLEYDFLAGIGSVDSFHSAAGSAFGRMRDFSDACGDWMMGMLSYDLKNETEDLTSSNRDGIGWPEMHFFCPEIIFISRNGRLKIGIAKKSAVCRKPQEIFDEVNAIVISNDVCDSPPCEIKSRMGRDEYLGAVRSLLHQIQSGNIFEVNYCQEFYADNAVIEPAAVYDRLNTISPAPFSCFFRQGERYLICSSPERFLRKKGDKIISQPVKGTRKRNANSAEDERLRHELLADIKERCENVMTVDLVRNDLAKTARTGSVRVEELFGIYSFPHVHQMISTITSRLRGDVHFVDAIREAFPMGSMTGAPKVRAMQMIEEHECTKRGVFSGAVGYVSPDKDFDFNVVIRSILYNRHNRYLSVMAGSGITCRSVPEQEYEECLVKAGALFRALGVKSDPVRELHVTER